MLQQEKDSFTCHPVLLVSHYVFVAAVLSAVDVLQFGAFKSVTTLTSWGHICQMICFSSH